MSTALLDHVRLSAEQEAVLARVRGHLAEAIAEAEADGDMPTDAETLDRIGELVERLTSVILESRIDSEHFVFDVGGVFAAMLASPATLVSFEQSSDRQLSITLEDRKTGERTTLSELPESDGIEEIRAAFVR